MAWLSACMDEMDEGGQAGVRAFRVACGRKGAACYSCPCAQARLDAVGDGRRALGCGWGRLGSDVSDRAEVQLSVCGL